ncbi:hypothetical protein MMC07_008159, partial [Pseudocyphellaria aurata]|nr:hypothetical protein [Pseudocyphellaria aurata]
AIRTQAPAVRWDHDKIQLVVNWLTFCDNAGNPTNLNTYMKENKSEAARRCIEATGLDTAMSDLSKQKMTNKLAQIMRQYKDWIAKLDATG